MKLTGHERDLASLAGTGDDLDYMHARHYSPLTGRFLSTDRKRGYPSAPQSWNRYSYAYGSPTNFVDPDGYEPIPPELLGFYNSFYGADFSNVSLHTISGSWGYTLGNQVFLPASIMSQVQAGHQNGLAFLGHELAHVRQYNLLGLSVFLQLHLLDIGANIAAQAGRSARGVPPTIVDVNGLHDSLVFERLANKAEARIGPALETTYRTWTWVETCGYAGGKAIDCSATVTWHTNKPLVVPPQDLAFALGLGLSLQGLPFSLVGSPYDLFWSGAVCIERICV